MKQRRWTILHRAALALAPVLLFAAGGCGRVTLGPQFDRLPEGAAIPVAGFAEGEKLFGEPRWKKRLSFYFPPSSDRTVTVDEFSGPTSDDEIRSTREKALERARPKAPSKQAPGIHLGPLEELTIDKRRAFGWIDQFGPDDHVGGRRMTAVVSYDDRTYLVSYDCFTDGCSADHLRSVVTSFVDVRSTHNDLLVGIFIALAAGGLVYFFRKLGKARPRDS